MESFLRCLPKVELHVHLEGTMEPNLMFQLAKRNKITIPFENVDALQQAYANFIDLQSFLDLMEKLVHVLITSEDFYDLAWAYFQRAAADNVRHCEIFLDVQAHLNRGVTLQCQFDGLIRACQRAHTELNMTTGVLVSFMRNESEQSALEVLEKTLEYREYFIGIGLDSSEIDHPPSKFIQLYQRAHELNLHCVAHAGEEGPAAYVKQAIELLHIERIDHGIHCADDPELLQQIARNRIPLTVCPLSNVRLRVVKNINDLPIKLFLDNDIKITINSDDPGYFGGYMLTNFNAVQEAFQLSIENWVQLTKNAIYAAFITDKRREELVNELEDVLKNHK
jgi:adenosine deaminase